MVKYELCLCRGKEWLETRVRPGKGNASGKITAITWAAEVASRMIWDGATEAVLRLVTANHNKAIWNLADFVAAVRKICTCSPRLREEGIHSSECPIGSLSAHDIWSRR
jgi:hypothetical protein